MARSFDRDYHPSYSGIYWISPCLGYECSFRNSYLCGISAAAIFLDTIRWVGTTYSQPKPDPEYLAKRLEKEAIIIVYIFQTMAELKPSEQLQGPPAQSTQSNPLNRV